MDYHQHLLIDADVLFAPTNEEYLKDWFNRLVKAVNMEVFHEPLAKYCDDPDNQGITGMVWLTTSHASIHFWDSPEQPFVHFDLYSCKEFELETVLTLFKEFCPTKLHYMIIDRTNPPAVVTAEGTIHSEF